MDKRDSVLVNAAASSMSRVAGDRREVSDALDPSDVKDCIRRVVKPTSLSGSMKKVGIVLILAPEPISTVPGVALLASSYAMKRREPASLQTLNREADKQLDELRSFSLSDLSLSLG